MFKRLISSFLVISIFFGSLTAYAITETPDIILDTNYLRGSNKASSYAASELQIQPDKLRVSNVADSISYSADDFEFEEYNEALEDAVKATDTAQEKTIPAEVTEVENYVSLNEEDEEDIVPDDDVVIEGEITPISQPQTYSARTTASALDSAYRMNNINSKDTFALKNQTGRTNYIGDNLGEEYVDPLTGNLIVTETDLSLPGVDGLDLNLSRYYSLAEAEFYTKAVGIETDPEYNTFLLENGGFVVTETVTNTETGEVSTYDYFYLSQKQANKRKEEIETRDTNNNLFDYDATVTRKAAGETVAVDYYYTSEITSTSYSRKRNNLGAGWSWGFPSVEVIKDNYNDITEAAKAIYYHDGKGNTMEVEYTSGNGYSFANYVGKDITFEDYFDYDTDVCSTSRIDYIVDNPDGTKYYFGA